MSNQEIHKRLQSEYTPGFTTDIESDSIAPGLNEDVVRLISAKKNEPEFMLNWRLKAYRLWTTMTMPAWQHLKIEKNHRESKFNY